LADLCDLAAAYPSATPLFDISFIRVDRDDKPIVIEALLLTVDWPVLPREREGVDISEDLEAQTVESVGGSCTLW